VREPYIAFEEKKRKRKEGIEVIDIKKKKKGRHRLCRGLECSRTGLFLLRGEEIRVPCNPFCDKGGKEPVFLL